MGTAKLTMDSVIELGLKLSGVTESAYYGARALKLNGQMLACTPVHKSAEANSLVVALGFTQRAALLEKHPSIYYVTDHYAAHSSMLVRLPKISRTELERTLSLAWGFVSAERAPPRSAPKRAKTKGGQKASAKAKA